MKNIEKYDISNEINNLLKSEKKSDEVETESKKIISKKLHQYKIQEAKTELFFIKNPAEEIKESDIGAINNEKLQDNFIKFKKTIDNEKRLDFVNELSKEFPDANFYIVGGMIRDALIDRKSKDIDMVVCGIDKNNLEKVLKKFGKVDLVGKNFGVYKLWLNEKFVTKDADFEQMEIDIALPRIEKSGESGSRKDFEISADANYTIEDDLARRDLTVNAMAYDLLNKKLIDPFNAREDLINHEIKSVNNPEERFSEDYSRILRALRFAIKLNAKIEKNTWNSIEKNFHKIIGEFLDKDSIKKQIVPWEVIGSEIKKMFITNPIRALDLLNASGGLKYIFPEVDDLKKYQQPKEYHPEGDVYNHTRLVLNSLPAESSLTLIFAALLHDIGKAKTQQIEKNGKITFYGHARESAISAKKICERLRFTRENTEKICLLVEKHMQIHNIKEMKIAKIYKILIEEMPRELLRLGQVDTIGSLSGDTMALDFAKEKISEFVAKKELIKPLVMGRDLQKLSLEPGPIFKKILDKLFEIQVERNIINKNELLDYAKILIKEEIILI